MAEEITNLELSDNLSADDKKKNKSDDKKKNKSDEKKSTEKKSDAAQVKPEVKPAENKPAETTRNNNADE